MVTRCEELSALSSKEQRPKVILRLKMRNFNQELPICSVGFHQQQGMDFVTVKNNKTAFVFLRKCSSCVHNTFVIVQCSSILNNMPPIDPFYTCYSCIIKRYEINCTNSTPYWQLK